MSCFNPKFKIRDHAKINASFLNLVKALREKDFEKNIHEAFYLGGFVYSDDNYSSALLSIENSTLGQLINALEYDVRLDDLEFYYLVYNTGETKLIVVFDPFELYASTQILNIFPYCTEKN